MLNAYKLSATFRLRIEHVFITDHFMSNETFHSDLMTLCMESVKLSDTIRKMESNPKDTHYKTNCDFQSESNCFINYNLIYN